jgi:hypothetical protein
MRGMGCRINVVRKLRVPVAAAVRRFGKPAEITGGAPPQGFLRRRRPVLECLKLGDPVKKIGQIAGRGAFNCRSVRNFGAARGARKQGDNQRQ